MFQPVALDSLDAAIPSLGGGGPLGLAAKVCDRLALALVALLIVSLLAGRGAQLTPPRGDPAVGSLASSARSASFVRGGLGAVALGRFGDVGDWIALATGRSVLRAFAWTVREGGGCGAVGAPVGSCLPASLTGWISRSR